MHGFFCIGNGPPTLQKGKSENDESDRRGCESDKEDTIVEKVCSDEIQL